MASLKDNIIGNHDAYRLITGSEAKFADTTMADKLKNLPEYFFSSNANISHFEYLGASSLRAYALINDSALRSFNMPNLSWSVGNSAFYNTGLIEVKKEWWPTAREVSGGLFNSCSSLISVELPSGIKAIYLNAFFSCTKLSELKIYNQTSVVTMSSSDAFKNSLIATSTTDGYVYVPYDLVNSYKSAANWTQYASKIRELGYWLFKDGTVANDTYNIANSAMKGNNEIRTVEQIFFRKDLQYPAYVDGYAFEECENLEEVELRHILSVGNYSFRYDRKLTEFVAPKLTQIGWAAFQETGIVKAGPFPNLTRLIGLTYYKSANLKEADLGESSAVLEAIPASSFSNTSLEKLVLRYGGVVPLEHTNAFANTPIASGKGWIYVRDSLAETYKSEPNWTQYASRIRGLSQL